MGLAALAMHGVGAVFWGSILGDSVSLAFSVRGIAAHLIASSAASMWVCLAVASTQGLTLAVLGPRLFRRASTVLQVVLVGLIVFCLASLPALNTSIVDTLAGGAKAQPWILSMPPVWFLGVYEWVLGTNDPTLLALARQAAVAIATVALATVVTYPLAYRRLMVSVVETGSEPRNALGRVVQAVLVGAAGRHPAAKATAAFFTATIARVERQRFVLAIALGLAVAWGLPGLRTSVSSSDPVASLLALPMAAMMFLTAGLRITASLPADVRAAWLFDVHHLSRKHSRQALERTMFVVGVLPAVAVSAPVYWYLWGAAVAVTHALVMVALGIALIELLIWHCDGMPCGQQWTPARMDFGRRWPLYVAVFLLVVAVIPRVELVMFRHDVAAALVVLSLLGLALVVRYFSAKHQIVPVYEDVDPVAGVLRLN